MLFSLLLVPLQISLYVVTNVYRTKKKTTTTKTTPFIFRPLTSYNKRESCASSATTTTLLGLPSSNYASQRGSNGALHLYALPMPPRAISPLMQVNFCLEKTKQNKNTHKHISNIKRLTCSFSLLYFTSIFLNCSLSTSFTLFFHFFYRFLCMVKEIGNSPFFIHFLEINFPIWANNLYFSCFAFSFDPLICSKD